MDLFESEAAPLTEGKEPLYAEVAIPVPLRRTFTYRIDPSMEGVVPGARVAVPFARRKVIGVVTAVTSVRPEGVSRVLRVAGTLDPEPVFPEEVLAFLRRAAEYYFHPVGEVLRAA
ncbi:MAG: hypothetical protein KC416_03015, partial [Myxococcales bacterium]|nr:hypothetical protein [Myxococcales bacterium]